jgi:hypothetical protein
VAERTWKHVPDAEHMVVLARHLAPVAVTLFLAQGFFLAGYFDPIGALPLGVPVALPNGDPTHLNDTGKPVSLGPYAEPPMVNDVDAG